MSSLQNNRFQRPALSPENIRAKHSMCSINQENINLYVIFSDDKVLMFSNHLFSSNHTGFLSDSKDSATHIQKFHPLRKKRKASTKKH